MLFTCKKVDVENIDIHENPPKIIDDRQMRDRLGYWLFGKMGIPAPRATHAKLLINGEYVGVFALIENIDVRFTRHNYDSGEGNLYKEV